MAKISDIVAEAPELAELAAKADGHQLRGASYADDFGIPPADIEGLPSVFDKYANFALDLELLPWMAAFLIWLHVLCPDSDIRLSSGHFWDEYAQSVVAVTVDGVLITAKTQLCTYEHAQDYWCMMFVNVGTSDYHFHAVLCDRDSPEKYNRTLQKLKQVIAHRNWYL